MPPIRPDIQASADRLILAHIDALMDDSQKLLTEVSGNGPAVIYTVAIRQTLRDMRRLIED